MTDEQPVVKETIGCGVFLALMALAILAVAATVAYIVYADGVTSGW